MNVLYEVKSHVAYITLNRVEKRNAFNAEVIQELLAVLQQAEADSHTRVVVLQANGSVFSAGADLEWMQSMVDLSYAENIADATELAELMRCLNFLSKPTIAKVQGAAFGGALGLIACCDIAIASDNASFCLSEAKIGLAPATIGPYVFAAIGERACRRYFQTAEVFDAAKARELGLLHEVVPNHDLAAKTDELCLQLLRNGPQAMAEGKALIATMQQQPLSPALIEHTVNMIARLRTSDEGQAGLKAFFAKEKAPWVINLK